MSQQRKSNSMKTMRLHLWNNGQRSSDVISRITKTPLAKIKQQDTIEDRTSSDY